MPTADSYCDCLANRRDHESDLCSAISKTSQLDHWLCSNTVLCLQIRLYHQQTQVVLSCCSPPTPACFLFLLANVISFSGRLAQPCRTQFSQNSLRSPTRAQAHMDRNLGMNAWPQPWTASASEQALEIRVGFMGWLTGADRLLIWKGPVPFQSYIPIPSLGQGLAKNHLTTWLKELNEQMRN